MSRRSPSPSSTRRRRDADDADRYRRKREYESSAPRDRRDRDNESARDRDSDRYRRNQDRDDRGERYRRDRERDDYRRDRERDRDGRRRSASPPPRTSRPRSPPPRASRPRSRSPGRPSSSRPRSPGRPASRPRSKSPLAPAEDKAKPNFAPSGLLAAATNTVRTADGRSTLLKYNEPPEARKPSQGWRLYVFKGQEQVDLLHIHRQSAYLIGRDHTVADIAIDHPSCSKQHAVIQFRYVPVKDEFGGVSKGVVKPFVIDLESTNGTHVNDETIPTTRYYELKASDVLKFGTSAREYVLLHDEAT
ncbi:SMAD/FHA domain-containing protein [Artomyces pyxidatus]|uniref:SMAD/FHA domain-containing protein n=1 Tax=Artomyces pyxidatus TaxID=48021 RepID=A0ACB8SNF8_9AGAM|nr:SMAD/FHA domain-containing protein [Artomyces pyxidatus]